MTLIEEATHPDFGPAMRALTPNMRAFVQAMVANPGCNRSKAAAAAGYSANSPGALRVTVHRLMHDERVLAAMDELTVNRLQSSTLVAAAALERIITSRGTKDKDRLKAIGMVLDRTGHSATQTINVNKTVTRKVDVSAAEDKIAEFRRKFPEQFAKLIGGDAAAPAVIEGEFTEVAT
jgi:phage terminase small subunit